MSNFILQHRKNDTVYDTIELAKEAILGIQDGVDGEMVVSRYLTKSGEVKSVKGVCYNDGSEYNWTIFSYDDDMIAGLSIEGADIDLSGYLKKSEFNPYSSATQVELSNKVTNDEFNTYKDSISTILSSKVDKTVYESYTATTRTTLQNLEDNKADKNKAVGSAYYDSDNKQIKFKAVDGTLLPSYIDASEFLKNGMVDSVKIVGDKLVITFNTDANGKEDIEIDLNDIFKASDYYTKTEIDSKVREYETIEDYESDGDKSLTDICFIKDGRDIIYNNYEYGNRPKWAKFEEEDEEYMDIVVYNRANGEKEIYTGSELEDMDVENMVPIGVVVIPSSHDVYSDGRCGVMSLVSMSLTTPDVGNIGKDIVTDRDHHMSLGYSGHGLTAYDNYPQMGTMDQPINNSIVGSCTQYCMMPTDYPPLATGIESITDFGTYYFSSNESTRFYGVSPYSGKIRNELYTTTQITNNSLAQFIGEENSAAMVAMATAQPGWMTDATITDSVASGYYPAPCCCYRFHTEGTEQGDWYLPSIAELGYVIVRFGKITNTLEYINTKFDGSYTTPIDFASLQNIWSSTPKAGNGAFATASSLNASLANRASTSGNKAQVRAFTKL